MYFQVDKKKAVRTNIVVLGRKVEKGVDEEVLGIDMGHMKRLEESSNGCRGLVRTGRLLEQKERLEGCCNLTMMYRPRCQPLLVMSDLLATVARLGTAETEDMS